MNLNEVIWHYSVKQERKGPVSLNEIIQLYNDGIVSDRSRLWNGINVKEWYVITFTAFCV